MGSKQTKVEEFLPESFNHLNNLQLKDISEKSKKKAEHKECNEVIHKDTPVKITENLRKRFLGGFIYNLNDPRSPGLNRTPLVVEENDKSLNLNDTFADLFVVNRALPTVEASAVVQDMEIEDNGMPALSNEDVSNPPFEFNDFEKLLSNNESGSVEFTSICEEETMPSPTVLLQTPTMFQQALDPRSPTIGLPRTPIIFEDDEETQENAMLEDILATLSLDLSGTSNFNSFGTETVIPMIEAKKPTNKHLERIRKPEKPKRKSKQITHKQQIFLDSENTIVTPRRKLNNSKNDIAKRTPLSCMKNRSHLRSRSVESKGESSKPRLSLTSYDDSLNPIQDSKIIDLHALQSDPFEL